MKKFLKTIVIFLAFGVALTGCYKEYFDVRNIDGRTATGAAIMVMDTATVSKKLQVISEAGTLSFHNLTAEDMPTKGDIICSAPSKAAPQGFFYKVKDISTKGNETTIITEIATIEEAVKNVTEDRSFDLAIENIDKREGVEVVSIQHTQNSQLRAAKLTLLKLQMEIPLVETGLDTAYVKGEIELNSTLNCKIDINNWSLKHFELTAQPQFKAKLTTKIRNTNNKDINFHIATIKNEPIVFSIGVIPIVITPELSIDATLTINGEVKLQATLIDWDYSFTFGSRYDNGVFTSISENISEPAKYLDDIQLTMNGYLKFKPELTYKFKLYNTDSYASIGGDFYAKLAVTNITESNKKIAFSCGLEFKAKSELNILSHEIGKWELTFGSFDWLIWEKTWGLTEDINNIIPDEYIETLENLGLDINYGYNPPLIEGTFLSHMVIVNQNFSGKAANYNNMYLTFSEQNNSKLTVKLDYKADASNGSNITAAGLGAFIVGENNKFSVFVNVDKKDNKGVLVKTVEVHSGEIAYNGIKNYQLAIIMVDDNGDPYNAWIDNGQGILQEDSDGFSEKITNMAPTTTIRANSSNNPTNTAKSM